MGKNRVFVTVMICSYSYKEIHELCGTMGELIENVIYFREYVVSSGNGKRNIIRIGKIAQ